MSKETSRWLNLMTLIGFTKKRGNAWHYRAEDQGDENNHYADAIPVDDVTRRLFSFDVESTPLFTRIGDVFEEIPNRQAMRRTDNGAVLGIFRPGYSGHSYRTWLLENVSNLLDDTLGIGSAGLLKNGAQAWVSVEVPETIVTPEGIEFRPNLLACTSFDGSLATTYKRVVQNVVCDNTLSAGLSEGGQVFRVKHTKNSALRISDARDALVIVHTMADEFAAEVAQLCADDVSAQRFARVLDALIPTPDAESDASKRSATMAERKRQIIGDLYATDPRVAPWAGTAFGVLQAFNTYAHHEGIVRNVTRQERNMSNALLGKTEQADAHVLRILADVS